MIHLLDKNTINKIAAGEVIERPASVVKELVENAIDAGADCISVEIENGGCSLIRVSDNGSGIAKNDIRNAFVKHATSKISSLDDLENVSTLGFRGEALSSIASVSDCMLLTKVKAGLLGYAYNVAAGEEKSFEETGVPEGTTVVVKDLFFNTPVRKKFLRSESAEGAAVLTLMEHIALSAPDISFKLTAGGKEKLYTTGNGNLKEVVFSIYGRDIASNLIEVNVKNDEVGIRGFIGKPAISRGNRSFENYAVNGRYIMNDSLSMAIEDAYKGFIMLHNYPFTALLFDIDPTLLDVNVHPSKREFRLTASDSVCAFVRESLRAAITQADIIPAVTPGRESAGSGEVADSEGIPQSSVGLLRNDRGVADSEGIPQSSAGLLRNDKTRPGDSEGDDRAGSEESEERDESEVAISEGIPQSSVGLLRNDREVTDSEGIPQSSAGLLRNDKTRPGDSVGNDREGSEDSGGIPQSSYGLLRNEKGGFKGERFEQQEIREFRSTNRYRLIGQLFATYWLIEADDTFYMMDQHAAHEKILYERLMKRTDKKAPQTQLLTIPEIIDVSPETSAYLEESSEVFDCFKSLGYEVETFGDNTVKVTGIPAGLPAMDYRQMITDVLDLLCDKTDMGISQGDTPQIMIEKIASMSCKAAIKGNDRISANEALSLLDEMMVADNPYNCPHGRPTLVSMSKYEIEKKFKRIV